MSKETTQKKLEDSIQSQAGEKFTNSHNLNEAEFEQLVTKYFQTHSLNEEEMLKVQQFQELYPQKSQKIIQRGQEEVQKQILNQRREQVELLRANNFTEQGAISKLRAQETSNDIFSRGGKKILHITDTESKAQDLESRLLKLFQDENVLEHVEKFGTIPENTILVHTGDIGPDLFDIQEHRFRAFLPSTLIKEGELKGESAEEFESLYRELMDEVGVSDEFFIQGIKTQEDQQILQQFQMLLYGSFEPPFKTKEELEEFRKKRGKLHKHLEDAIKNHSRRNLEEIKQIFDKYGLNEENFVIISGNHDIPYQVQEIFSDSYLKEGETRSLRGIKINRPLAAATGSVYGPILGRDFMGSNELIEQIPQMRYNSQPFQELKQYVQEELGFSHINNRQIDDLIKYSVRKAQFGFAPGRLKEINDEIEHEVQRVIKTRLERIPQNIDNNADVFIGHGDPTHPMHAGLEETYLRKQLDNKGLEGKMYLGGHIHEETTNQTNGTPYINPGASKAYNAGSVLVSSDNKFIAATTHKIAPTQEYDTHFRLKQEIAGQRIND
ncbi:MAG: hypothetical protein ACMXYB_03650 [Candidatus Woesearchaeota archaeon]